MPELQDLAQIEEGATPIMTLIQRIDREILANQPLILAPFNC